MCGDLRLIHSTLCLYSTTANLTIAYNVGAIDGMTYALHVSSGVIIAMSYIPTGAMVVTVY